MSQVAHVSKNVKDLIKSPNLQQNENIFAGIRSEQKVLRGILYAGVPRHVRGTEKSYAE
jgi:hypothetical protein